jgi:hypothetical protein
VNDELGVLAGGGRVPAPASNATNNRSDEPDRHPAEASPNSQPRPAKNKPKPQLSDEEIEKLLAGKRTVNRLTAQKAISRTARTLRKLVAQSKLTETPEGMITTESIRTYKGWVVPHKEIRK